MASQCVHAALGCVRLAQQIQFDEFMEDCKSSSASSAAVMDSLNKEQLRQQYASNIAIWESTGEKAVCLKCKSLDVLHGLVKACNESNPPIPNYYVMDAGRTEIEPNSITVLAIGPDLNEKINSITGSLKLY